ncbi:MAG: hypothetical protein N3A38_05980 [Planctomycetota bacterium]|nr:hypothetical protein [Planctomycetota bacterium]
MAPSRFVTSLAGPVTAGMALVALVAPSLEAGETPKPGEAPATSRQITHIKSRRDDKAVVESLRAGGYRFVLAPAPASSGQYDLYVAGADGSQQVNITSTADKDERLPRVNFRTGRIAFVTAGAASGTARDDKGRHGRLAFVDPDGRNREETEVTEVSDKGWNPDGTKLALSYSDRKKFGFRIYDTRTKQIQTFAKDKNGILDIDWSPDPNLLACATRKEMGFRYTILTMNADGTKIRPLTSESPNSDKPYCHSTWHPSEMRLAWNSRDGLLVGIYDPATGKATDVKSVVSFADVGWEDPCPRWSPDGNFIAFIRNVKPKRLCVVRVADSVWAELPMPKEWGFEPWDYDWLPKTGSGGG